MQAGWRLLSYSPERDPRHLAGGVWMPTASSLETRLWAPPGSSMDMPGLSWAFGLVCPQVDIDLQKSGGPARWDPCRTWFPK